MHESFQNDVIKLIQNIAGEHRISRDKLNHDFSVTNRNVKNEFSHTFDIQFNYYDENFLFIVAEFKAKAKLLNKYYFPVNGINFYYYDSQLLKIFNRKCRLIIKKLSKCITFEIFAQRLLYKSSDIKNTKKARDTIRLLFKFIQIFNKSCIQKKHLISLALKSPSPVIRLQTAYWIEINYDERKSEIKDILDKCFNDFFLKLAYTAGHLMKNYHYKENFKYSNVEKRLLIQDNHVIGGLNNTNSNMFFMERIFKLLKVKLDEDSLLYIYQKHKILRFDMIVSIFLISTNKGTAFETFNLLKRKKDFKIFSDIQELYNERKINPEIRKEVRDYIKKGKEEFKGLVSVSENDSKTGALSDASFTGAVSNFKRK